MSTIAAPRLRKPQWHINAYPASRRLVLAAALIAFIAAVVALGYTLRFQQTRDINYLNVTTLQKDVMVQEERLAQASVGPNDEPIYVLTRVRCVGSGPRTFICYGIHTNEQIGRLDVEVSEDGKSWKQYFPVQL